jgi:lipopolysaccharide/colanic/teichoic acid biosynthesis glycosyltransferase
MKVSSGKFEASVASGDDARVLPFGHFLRETHLDELPQLYSVLKGNMSLVGPRPYKSSHFESLPEDSSRIIASVKPGLTGLDSLMFIAEDEALKEVKNPEIIYLKYFLPEKAKQQLHYIKIQSNREDVRLIFATLRAMLFRHARHNSVYYLRSLFADKGNSKGND